MNNIENLLMKMCPDGIQFKKIKEICSEVIVPMRDRPKVFDGEIPWCRIEDIEGKFFNKSLSGLKVSQEVIKEMNLKVFPMGTVICSCSASIGVYAINTQPLITNQTFIGLVCGKEICNKYLLYFMETQTKNLIRQATTGTIPYISRNKFEELEVPVPPMEIQQEIVRILDRFTELEAGLQAELDVRKKQYEYYKEKLLTFDEKMSMVTLPAISVNHDRKRKPITGNQREQGSIPYYGASGVVDYVKDYLFDGDYLLISEDGANLTARVTPIAFSISGKTWVNNHAHILQFQTGIDRKFVEYYLNSIDLSYYTTGAAQPKLNQYNLNKIPIPNPSFEEKKKIVEILDVFSGMCNDLEIGLPAEIEARHKQYEYYRDKLLTFERKVV